MRKHMIHVDAFAELRSLKYIYVQTRHRNERETALNLTRRQVKCREVTIYRNCGKQKGEKLFFRQEHRIPGREQDRLLVEVLHD